MEKSLGDTELTLLTLHNPDTGNCPSISTLQESEMAILEHIEPLPSNFLGAIIEHRSAGLENQGCL